MKKSFFTFLALLCVASVFSCTPEERAGLIDQLKGDESGQSTDGGPSQKPLGSLTGSYALDDGSGLTDTYVSFIDGQFYEYELETVEKIVLAEGSLWNVKTGDFKQVNAGNYSISDGILYTNGVPYGEINLTEKKLQLAEKTYTMFTGMKRERYMTITVEGGLSQDVSYLSRTILASVSKTIPSGVMTASTESVWILAGAWENDLFSLIIAENNTGEGREGCVTLSYPGAEDVVLTVRQNYSTTSLSLTPASQEMDYTGGTFSFDIELTNPREGASITAVSQNDWITDVTVDGKTVTYKVLENHSVKTRIGSINVSYKSSEETFADNAYVVSQGDEPISLSLNKNTLALIINKINTETLTATYTPSDAILVWSSDNTAVASVGGSGQVTACGNGEATITVKALRQIDSEDGSNSAACTVTVTTAVTGVSLNKPSLLMSVNGWAQLTAMITPTTASNKQVSWSSANPSVATIDQNGNVTAKGKGHTTITVTTRDGGKMSSCPVTVWNPTSLSVSGTANCYIVSSSGTYSFPTVKGNSSISVGNVSQAEVLWESFGTSTAPMTGDIIQNVFYSYLVGNGSSVGTICFSTPSALKNGNAVIAAKDADGNILWSWHIWVREGYDPVATVQTYYNNAGMMMSCNLGATSSSLLNSGTLGLLYQWGRKDPFLGSSSISSSTKAASTISWPSPVSSSSSNGTIAYATSRPTTFITGKREYDWVYSSRNNTLWQSSKTIYDPCPPGWRVPDGGPSGVWSKAANTSNYFSYTWNSTSKGMDFSEKFGSAWSIWYPAAGSLDYDSGSLYSVGFDGSWWSCTASLYDPYSLELSGDKEVAPSRSSSNYRAQGKSVRCQKEE